MDGLMMDYPLTVPALLDRAACYFPGVEVVSRRPDRSLARSSYGEVRRRAHQLAGALARLGVGRGDRVATLGWNNARHLEAYFGVPLMGGVLHTLNPRLSAADLVYIVNHAGDSVLLADDVLLPVLDRLRDQMGLKHVVVWTNGTHAPEGTIDGEELIAAEPEEFAQPRLDELEAAAMCYTSGTTGRPKGVVYSHRAIVLHSLASASADGLAIGQREVVCPVVPMFHVNAWGLPFTATMAGCKQVLPGPHLDPESLLGLYAQEGVTLTAGVPTIWLAILQALDNEPDRWKLRGLRMVVGGSAAPESLIRGLDRHGLRLVHAWGMTEMTPIGTVSWLKRSLEELPQDQQYEYRAKQGLPLPFVETRIMKETGEAPWDGKAMGELEVRGPWVAASYYQAPEFTGKWSDDGWFRTGDVATIDPEGYVKITDRTKDLVKSGGEWISTVDLENALMGHPVVAQAAVIAAKHPKWDERPVAIVVLKQGASVTAGELRAFLEPKFAKFWLPDEFVFTSQIPLTAAGKFEKSTLRQQYGDLLIDQLRSQES
ncbi:MAG TPA: long-chain fatty acid--CoA ligase [Streptosporangiaceae bacterium]|nr:long-chain fatty acid--CoA ligase [Streptosporangiaceae bacterium]